MSHWLWSAFQRELRSSWKKLSLAALSLMLGMSALTALLLADAQLEAQTRRQADFLLGGDAEISDVRLLPDSLLESLQGSPQVARKTRVTSFVSLASVTQNSRARLVEVLAIDDAYPLVPGMKVQPPLVYEQLRSGGILVEKSFAVTHSLSVTPDRFSGEPTERVAQKLLQERKALRIGKRTFPIVGLVENDQMRDFASLSLGSRLYMAREVATRQKLISNQSRMRDRLILQFTTQNRVEKSLEWLRGEINKVESSKPSLRSKDDALRGAFKPTRSLFLFFNAIGFSALLLLGLGSAQSIHSYLKRKIADAAILSNLGAPRALLALLYVGNVIIVTLVALGLGAWIGQALFQSEFTPRLGRWFAGAALDVTLFSHFKTIVKFTLAAFVLTASLILPGALSFLRYAKTENSLTSLASPQDPWFKKVILHLLGVLENFPDLVWLLSALLLSFFISTETAFNLMVVVILGLIYLVLRLAVLMVSRFGLNPDVRLPLALRIAGSEISARPTQSSLTLLLFGISVCLLVFIWDLRTNITTQIQSATSGQYRPNVFVLDAPPDAVRSVREILTKNTDSKNILSEKITRARLLSINGKSADDWLSQFSKGSDEYQRAARLFNREQNLTSRDDLLSGTDAEELVAGKFWRKDSSKKEVNEVSVEAGLAQNLSMDIGDTLEFDIQGVPVKVKITSLRRVRWQSFRPNFFFVLHPSVLADAPYSAIFATNLPDPQKRADTINTLLQNHPGMTTIDATEIAELAERLLTAALEIVRFLTILLFAGALINIVLSAWTSFSLRAQNFSLYRCLGANNSLVLKSIISEFMILAIVGCGTGIFASWLLSALVQRSILTVDDQLNLAFLPGLSISSMVVAICVLAAVVSALLILRQAPFRVLRRPG